MINFNFLWQYKNVLINKYSINADRMFNKQFYNYPFGSKPHADKEKYIEIWSNAKSKTYTEIDSVEKQYNYAVDSEWLHNLALQTQVVIKGSDICYQHGRLLYAVLCSYISKNLKLDLTVVETGTARGFSSICMAKAIADMKGHGKIVTFDVIPNDTIMYWGCIADHEGPKTRQELLSNYNNLLNRIIFMQGDTKLQIKKFSSNRVNFAFLDGGHAYEDVMNDFESVHGRQEAGDIIIFDDYTPSMFPGIVSAVDEICSKYNYTKQVVMAHQSRGYVIAVKE
jgi:hypothetical protein